MTRVRTLGNILEKFFECESNMRISTKHAALLLATALVLTPAALSAEPRAPAPFTRTLSNTVPLAFGMNALEATAALGVPLVYVRGRPGNETFAAERPSPVYLNREARLFLQFRNGRLTGWKGDWGRNWMWR